MIEADHKVLSDSLYGFVIVATFMLGFWMGRR